MMNKWQVIVGGVLLVIVGSLIWQRPFQTNGQTSEQALVQRLDRDAMMTAVKQPLLQIPETETPKAVSVQPETKSRQRWCNYGRRFWDWWGLGCCLGGLSGRWEK
ncbi:hypothetical protein [Secundilactobacillus similis]|uniref:hypothetical protein n=1 Tax=Secundilactobacillus similis TaxID=414682 RepID=UPI0006D21747|nr:hypothetical protein [Secundilactobacillus similis]